MKSPVLDFNDPREIDRREKRPPDPFRILYPKLFSRHLSRRLTACRFYPALKKRRFSVGMIDTPWQNCFGFAFGYEAWLSPESDFWWSGARKSTDLRAWVETLDGFGFRDGIENGRVVALYAKDGHVTHAAVRQTDGRWKSKLGQSFAIFGHFLSDLEDDFYGRVVRVMTL